jgi:hypothetical protein
MKPLCACVKLTRVSERRAEKREGDVPDPTDENEEELHERKRSEHQTGENEEIWVYDRDDGGSDTVRRGVSIAGQKSLRGRSALDQDVNRGAQVVPLLREALTARCRRR